MEALLVLEDGRAFHCKSFTGSGEAFGEIVFNTSMSGYQEVLTDPSYKGQMVTMTYPLIGNYGINPEDIESDRIRVSAFIVREYQQFPSNYRSTSTLSDYLSSQNILGVDSLDTRALTKHLRVRGAMRAGISTIDSDIRSLTRRVNEMPEMTGLDLAKEVSTQKPYRWNNEKVCTCVDTPDKTIWKEKDQKFSVVAFDFGIKYNILRSLEKHGCEIIVVPAFTSKETIKAMEPDGIFLSNGPGDPEPVKYAINTIKELLGYRPIFGICLGHQLLGLALGGKTYKLKFGHRGMNQPVKNLKTGRVEITSQNHGFAVDANSLSDSDVEITHINLNDNTVEGLKHRHMPIMAIQYHPEASPGPHDALYLFDEFTQMMKRSK